MSKPTYYCPNCRRDLAPEYFYANRSTSTSRPVQGWCAACSRRASSARMRAFEHLKRLHRADYNALHALYRAQLEAEGPPEPVAPGRRA